MWIICGNKFIEFAVFSSQPLPIIVESKEHSMIPICVCLSFRKWTYLGKFFRVLLGGLYHLPSPNQGLWQNPGLFHGSYLLLGHLCYYYVFIIIGSSLQVLPSLWSTWDKKFHQIIARNFCNLWANLWSIFGRNYKSVKFYGIGPRGVWILILIILWHLETI